MLVAFGLETSEFTLLIIAPFVAIRQISAYHEKYLRISWTYLDLLYRFGKRVSRDDYPNICLAVAQETLLWQPVKLDGWMDLGDVRKSCGNDLYSLLQHWTTD